MDLTSPIVFGLHHTSQDGGLVLPLTDHLLRPMPAQNNADDPCVQMTGQEVMLEDGYVYVEACSLPSGQPDSRRYSYATLRTIADSPPWPDGYQYDVGDIHLPWWTEAVLRSHQLRCAGPEE